MRNRTAACAILITSTTFATEESRPVAKYEHPSAERQQSQTASADVEVPQVESARVSFGKPGTMWWTVGGGVSNNLNRATDVNARVNLSYFIAQDVELAGEFGLWYYGSESDAIGFNPASYIRWHFLNTGKMTVFADVGIGVVLTTDDVPTDGTSFNFTPRAGGGITHQLGDSDTRIELGVRWAHISNARNSGDNDNPSRDSVMVYGGVIFPF